MGSVGSTDVGTDELLISRDGTVVTVTFNAPARMNAFSFEMYQGLHDLCDELAVDASAKVLVLRGSGGRAFAAGNQISDFLSRDAVDYEEWLQQLFVKIQRLPQVSVAVIDGVCVGGGLAVATHCDVRLARPGRGSATRSARRSGTRCRRGSCTAAPRSSGSR